MASTVKLSEVVPSRFCHLTPADAQNVERIRADLVDGSKMLLNNPHVFKNEAGKYELLAGHDRVAAAILAGWDEIPVRDFSGALNTDDAILAHFCKENLLRKDISKAVIAGEWLKRHPDWVDTKVAVESGCSSEYVGQVRAKLIEAGELQVVEVRTTTSGQTRTYKPRQVRGNVPSGNTIPHPTEKVLSREQTMRAQREAEAEARERAAMAGATASPKEEAGGVLPPSKSTQESEGSGEPAAPATPVSEVLDVPPVVPELGEDSLDLGTAAFDGGVVVALPAWVASARSVSGPFRPLTNTEAEALDEPACASLELLSVALKQAVARSRALRKASVAA